MKAEIQKTMDYKIIRLKNTYFFVDGTHTVKKTVEEKHLYYMFACLKKLDKLQIESLKGFLFKKGKLLIRLPV